MPMTTIELVRRDRTPGDDGSETVEPLADGDQNAQAMVMHTHGDRSGGRMPTMRGVRPSTMCGRPMIRPPEIAASGRTERHRTDHSNAQVTLPQIAHAGNAERRSRSSATRTSGQPGWTDQRLLGRHPPAHWP